MKWAFFLLLFFAFGCGNSNRQTVDDRNIGEVDSTLNVSKVASQKYSYEKIERVVIDLNNDGKKDSITLFGSEKEFYTRITFGISGSKEKFTFDNEGGWEKIYPSFLKYNVNTIESENIFLYDNKENGSFILLCGQIFEGGTVSSLFLIRDRRVDRIDLTEFENPIKLIDLNRDGLVNIIGNNVGELETQIDSLNADIVSYRPFFVYDVKVNGILLNKELTKKYNQEHYVWAGLDSVGKVRLLQYRDSRKPKILK